MATSTSVPARIVASMRSAIGDVTFGLADGAVSVTGLVFGVAAGTHDGSIVVLAGAAGAVAGAVSMMAGRFMDVQSVEQREQAQLDRERAAIEAAPVDYIKRASARLQAVGFSADEATVVTEVLSRHPEALVDHVAAYELGIAGRPERAPWVHAVWMFVAVLLASSVPILPFALLPMATARVVALIVTGALMAALGIARGRLGGVNIWWSAVQTMTIAGAAALAGVLIAAILPA